MLRLKILPVRDAVPRPTDTCKRSHVSPDFLGLAGANRIDIPRNHGWAGFPGAARLDWH